MWASGEEKRRERGELTLDGIVSTTRQNRSAVDGEADARSLGSLGVSSLVRHAGSSKVPRGRPDVEGSVETGWERDASRKEGKRSQLESK